MESIAGEFALLNVCFEFIIFLSCIVLLFLSSFVMCSLYSIVNVYGAINDLIRIFFYFISSLKKYASLYEISICVLSEDITAYVPSE